MSTSWEPLPSIYRSKQEFLASLNPCRLGDGHRAASWHPTIDKRVQQYAIEQRIKQLEIENVRLAASNARLECFERKHCLTSTPHPSTGDSWSS